MNSFNHTYQEYVESADLQDNPFGYDLDVVEKLEPYLCFLFRYWWRVDITGLQYLPDSGPALIVGNSGSLAPWPGMMLLYALMARKGGSRQVSILADMDWVQSQKLYRVLTALGFVQWSPENAKRLFEAGHIVATFPEGMAGLAKPFSERYRLREFDWTRFLPAVEENVPIYPMSTIGCDEALPVLGNIDWLADFLDMPAFPITPFFPWLPFPASLMSLPVRWHMRILKRRQFTVKASHADIIAMTRQQAKFTEGEIQAELNRLLRQRIIKAK
jgi:1-acyl-sn-glycerol-3-phosphate acyltransferase